jgi:predicted small secreted protein
MRSPIRIALGLLMLLAAAPLLTACHTTAGAGRDISAGGHALTGAADSDTPQ